MNEKTVLDREDVRRTLVRIAHEIVEKTGGEGVAVVGIHRRGAVLAARLRDLVAELVGEPVPVPGVLRFQGTNALGMPSSARPSSGKCRSSTDRMSLSATQSRPVLV